MATKIEYRPYIPEGYDGEPVDEVDALKRARALLAEEGRWMQGDWFQNDHPEVDPEDPFCNDWRACAEGAVLMVTVGAVRPPRQRRWLWKLPRDHRLTRERRREQSRIFEACLKLLVAAGRDRWPTMGHVKQASTFNDSTQACRSRVDVLAWFDDAIALAEGANETRDPEPF